MAGKHRRASSLGTTRMTAGVLTALTMASTCISTANAVPKVVSQPGTQTRYAGCPGAAAYSTSTFANGAVNTNTSG